MALKTTPNFAMSLLRDLIALKSAGGLTFVETSAQSGVHRFSFRVGGWPIVIDIDDTVLELRAYFDRDAMATGRIRQEALDALLGRITVPGNGGSAADALAALRNTVRTWLDSNARLFVKSPAVARHPDGWNNA